MRLIVVEDVNYFRYLALVKLLHHVFADDTHIVICDIREAQRLIKRHCRRYREVFIIGALVCHQAKTLTTFFSGRYPGIQVRFLLFSDMIGLQRLERHLVIGERYIFVAPDIPLENLITLLKLRGYKDKDKYIPVKFNANDESVITFWREKFAGTAPGRKLGRKDYHHSRCLKKKLDVDNEYALCLLWHFVCCAVIDYQWEKQRGARAPISTNHSGGHYHLCFR